MIKSKVSFVFFVGLFISLFITSSTVYAEEQNTKFNMPKIITMESYENNTGASENGGLLFLYANGKITNPLEEDVILIYSSLTIRSNFSGNIYSFFSDIKIDDGVTFSGEIITVSSVASYPDEIAIYPIFSFLEIFMNITSDTTGYVYTDEINPLIQKAMLMLFGLIAGLLLVYNKPAFFYQPIAFFDKYPKTTIKYGMILFAAFILFIVVFAYTILLLPVAALILALLFLLIYFGKIIFGAWVVGIVFRKIKIRTNLMNSFVVGYVLIEILQMIPYVKDVMIYFIIPIISLGMILTLVYEKLLMRRFDDSDNFFYNENKKIDIHKIRGIILSKRVE